MADFDTTAYSSGVETGSKMPSRYSGLSESIKAITAGLKEDAQNKIANRQQDLQTRTAMAAVMLKGGYQGDLNHFFKTGDLSTFTPKNEISPMAAMLGLVPPSGGQSASTGASTMLTPPEIGQQGAPAAQSSWSPNQGTPQGYPAVPAPQRNPTQIIKEKLADLGAGSRFLYREGPMSLSIAAPTFQQKQQVINKESVIRDLDTMQSLLETVPTHENIKARWEGARYWLEAQTGDRPELKTYNDFRQSMLGRIAGTVGGESGSRLSDQDAARMWNLFPDEFSTGKERILKWALFKMAVNNISAAYSGMSGSNLRLELKPAEMEALKSLNPTLATKYMGDTGVPQPLGTRKGKLNNIDTSWANTNNKYISNYTGQDIQAPSAADEYEMWAQDPNNQTE